MFEKGMRIEKEKHTQGSTDEDRRFWRREK